MTPLTDLHNGAVVAVVNAGGGGGGGVDVTRVVAVSHVVREGQEETPIVVGGARHITVVRSLPAISAIHNRLEITVK
jgi:hypothetical protein